jgi:peptide/nickel transport system substrate-binding protein
MDTNHNQLDDFFGLKPEDEQKDQKESLKESLVKKLSFESRMRLLPKVLSQRERYTILGLTLLALFSILAVPVTSYFHFTAPVPSHGGSFSEGILGEPRLINPLLAQANDADRDLTSLIYSGLMKYNEEGKLVPDLAKSAPEISSDGLSYTIYLKDNAYWHDGQKLTTEDIIFTIQTAQNPDYASPQRVSWQGVDIEKINDHTIRFKLKNKYAQFLNNLTVGILPKHLWQYIKPINFSLSELNVKPIGSGPYKFSKLKKDRLGAIDSYELVVNKQYYDGQPYIDTVILKFYNSEDEMIAAYNRNEVQNISFISGQNLADLKYKTRLQLDELQLPRYFGVFFNQNQSKILANKNVRIALNHATNRQAIIDGVLQGKGMVIDSPMVSGILDINDNVNTYSYDQGKAQEILKTDGWTTTDANGIVAKKDTRLTLKLTTSTWPELMEVATMIKDQWKAVGVEVTIEALPISQLQQVIKDREYQMLLFGEILNIDPDPFSLWHSSQKRDPGLNLALYDNKTADTILEQARQTINPLERRNRYDEFQKIVIDDAPAVFLYSPYYLYGQSKSVKGVSTSLISMPSDRFANIEKWYIDTSRSLKRD